MLKYHLVSDVLQDLVIDDKGYGSDYSLKIIKDEWAAGKIKLLHFPPRGCEARGCGASTTTTTYNNLHFRGSLVQVLHN